MKISRSLYIWGALLTALGVFILAFARPLLIWDRVVVQDFSYEFEYPHIWPYIHEQSTVRNNVVKQIGEQAAFEMEASGELDRADRELATYDGELFDTTGSARIHIGAIHLRGEDTTVEMISLGMQKMREQQYVDYTVLSSKHIYVDGHDALRRIETYRENCQNCSQRPIVVVTYVIENSILYQISLIEYDWLNLPRNLKIYNHIVDSFHIR
jgi:hypothetical protein